MQALTINFDPYDANGNLLKGFDLYVRGIAALNGTIQGLSKKHTNLTSGSSSSGESWGFKLVPYNRFNSY
jgi:hypothetical protein